MTKIMYDLGSCSPGLHCFSTLIYNRAAYFVLWFMIWGNQWYSNWSRVRSKTQTVVLQVQDWKKCAYQIYGAISYHPNSNEWMSLSKRFPLFRHVAIAIVVLNIVFLVEVIIHFGIKKLTSRIKPLNAKV